MTAAVIVMRQNRYMARFAEAGATDAAHAVTLEALGCRESWIFRRMTRRGVFVHSGDGRFYMDVPASREFVHRRARMMIALLVIGNIILAVLLILAWSGRL